VCAIVLGIKESPSKNCYTEKNFDVGQMWDTVIMNRYKADWVCPEPVILSIVGVRRLRRFEVTINCLMQELN
jgi:hypothetical protein